jgi:hypothetical protein
MKFSTTMTRIIPISSGNAPTFARSSTPAISTAATRGMFV